MRRARRITEARSCATQRKKKEQTDGARASPRWKDRTPKFLKKSKRTTVREQVRKKKSSEYAKEKVRQLGKILGRKKAYRSTVPKVVVTP